MEMCYDGALVMPSSYAVMSEEEMTYVEGGGTAQKAAYQAVKVAGNMAFYAIVGGGTIKAATTILRTVGTRYFRNILKNVLIKWVSVRVANAIVGTVVGWISGLGSLSVGGFLAEGIDRLDGKNDNQIYFSKIRI